jgi:hypothetical protein
LTQEYNPNAVSIKGNNSDVNLPRFIKFLLKQLLISLPTIN